MMKDLKSRLGGIFIMSRGQKTHMSWKKRGQSKKMWEEEEHTIACMYDRDTCVWRSMLYDCTVPQAGEVSYRDFDGKHREQSKIKKIIIKGEPSMTVLLLLPT